MKVALCNTCRLRWRGLFICAQIYRRPHLLSQIVYHIIQAGESLSLAAVRALEGCPPERTLFAAGFISVIHPPQAQQVR